MKAIEFIQKYSLKKAREVIAGCPRCYHYYHIVHGDYYTCPQRLRVAIKDIKCLVESLDRITQRGNHEFLQMVMIRVFKELEKVLNGGEPK